VDLEKNYPLHRRTAINNGAHEGLLHIAPTALGATHAKAYA